MSWTIINSCLYFDSFYNILGPKENENGVAVFTAPVGNATVPMIHLPDLASYTLWAFENPEKASGLILDTATEHVNMNEAVKAYTEITGKPALYNPVPIKDFVEAMGKAMPSGEPGKIGDSGPAKGDPTLVTFIDNFTGFFNVHRLAEGSQGLWTVDYAKLNEILPSRVKNVKEWMQTVDFQGERKNTLLSF
jgi:nucleoside-diphosphate-sugar epimerase